MPKLSPPHSPPSPKMYDKRETRRPDRHIRYKRPTTTKATHKINTNQKLPLIASCVQMVYQRLLASLRPTTTSDNQIRNNNHHPHITTHFRSPFPCCPAADSGLKLLPPPPPPSPKKLDLVLAVVTSVHPALLATSSGILFFFRFVLLDRPDHPLRLASAMFLAALRSALLCFRLRLDTRALDDADPGAGTARLDGPPPVRPPFEDDTL